jgi:hypothetical protein
VSGRLVSAVLITLVVGSLGACTLAVSFNTVPRQACDGGECMDGSFPDVSFDTTFPDFDQTLPPFDAGDAFFDDTGFDVGSFDAAMCTVLSEGDPCSNPDSCNAASTCVSGVCTKHPLANGTKCGPPPNACHSAPVCTTGKCGAAASLADGTTWKDDGGSGRCCSGSPESMTSTDNCGVCGIKCGAGEQCILVDGEYFCSCPTTDNSSCWSGCCSGTVTWHCSPSNCVGPCQAHVCPDGTSCVVGSSVDYCSY